MFKTLFTIAYFNLLLTSLFSQNVDSLVIREKINNFLNSNQEQKKFLSKEILSLNPDFNFVYNCLKIGKVYSSNVSKGFFEQNYVNKKGLEHPNLLFIPYDYNPQKKYQVRIFLHGAVSSFNSRKLIGQVNRKDTAWQSVKSINIYPAAWALSKWWSYDQYENISKLLNFIKENYNVDENNVYLTGISDGGSGTYYFSNFYQTPFSCYLPFIGSMRTLLFQTNKQMYINNYQGLNFYIVNGRKDEIFDINFIIPSIDTLKKVAEEVKFKVIDSSAHNMNWYPLLKDSVKNFISNHLRNPFPNTISYSTEKPDTFGRKFWVKIEKIGLKKGLIINESNTIIQNGNTFQLFPRERLFGQIEIKKDKNTVYVKTKNVLNYKLLISPEHFDLDSPIEIYTNEILSFRGFLTKDLQTLLNYYIEDNDREMLFASVLEIKVGKKFKEK